MDSLSKINPKKNYLYFQTKPSEPAVKPTATKNENSKRSLGRELIIKLN